MAYQWSTPIKHPQTVERTNKPLPDGIHTLDLTVVPIAWFSGVNLQNLQWNEHKIVLPEDLNPSLFRTLRAEDARMFPTAVKSTTSYPPPVKKAKGSMVLDRDGVEPVSFGGQTAKAEDGQIKFGIQKESQLPSISVEFNKSDSKTTISYRIRFFGNKSMETVSFYSPDQLKSGALKCPVPETHKKASEAGRLMALTLRFGKSTKAERWLNSILVSHGEETDTRKDRWNDEADFLKTMEGGPTTGFDEVVRRLFAMTDFDVVLYRELDEKAMACMSAWGPEYRYWESIMRLACLHGPFWWYAMQPGFVAGALSEQLGAWNKPENPPPVPFWIVRQFRAHVKNNVLEKLEPLEWDSIVQDPTKPTQQSTVVPHPDWDRFLHELSALRERAHRHRIVNNTFQLWREHPTSLEKVAQIDNQTDVHATLSTYRANGDASRVPAGTICNVEFVTDNQRTRLQGIVTGVRDNLSDVDHTAGDNHHGPANVPELASRFDKVFKTVERAEDAMTTSHDLEVQEPGMMLSSRRANEASPYTTAPSGKTRM